jgi:hypothetical protein
MTCEDCIAASQVQGERAERRSDMASTTEDIPRVDGHFDTSFGDPCWTALARSRSSSWFLGDDPCGPMVYLLDAPGAREDEGAGFPVHRHASDELRTVVRGALRVGRTWLRPGTVRLQAAGLAYGPELTGTEGSQELVLFADRRGFLTECTRSEDAEWDAMVRAMVERSYAGFLPEPESGEIARPFQNGFASSVPAALRNGRVDVVFDDPAWYEEAGVRWSFWALGARGSGPLVLLVDARAGAPAVPAMAFATDQLRVVLAGSCAIGDQSYGAGDVRVQDEGVPLGEEVTGPDGCRQIVVFAREGGAAPRLVDRAGATRLTGPYAELTRGTALVEIGSSPLGRT